MFGRRCSRCNRRCFQQQLLAFPRRYRRCANRLLIFASLGAERDVVAPTSVTEECTFANGRVRHTFSVARERSSSIGGVFVAGSVAKERSVTGGRAEVAFGIARKGERSSGRVFLANGIV